MENRTPTREQIKEFAQWCGFTDIRVFAGPLGWDGVNPSGEFKSVELDLNSLVRYALPKAREVVGADELSRRLQGWINDFIQVGVEPEYTLFCLLDNIRGGNHKEETTGM